ncbi:MAG: hypothetical protein ACLFSY_09275 [Desulfonatronovibrionaceae bacterium]
MRRNVCFFIAVFSFISLTACTLGRSPDIVPEESSLAVAGFIQPRHSWQLLAGYIGENRAVVAPEALASLDASLADALKDSGHKGYIRPPLVDQCRELILRDTSRSRVSALKYWLRVGKCIPTDYLLVPYVFEMREMLGNEWGVQAPATVVLDLYLIDIKNERMHRYHFEETQHSFSENMLEAKKFFRRGGKWLTAQQLAADGIKQGVQELGL